MGKLTISMAIFNSYVTNPPTPAESKGSASEKRVQEHKTFSSITVWQPAAILFGNWTITM